MRNISVLIDGNSSIQELQYTCEYASIRSHYYNLELIANKLQFDDILNYHSKDKIYNVLSGSELSFTNYTYDPVLSKDDLGIILHHIVLPENKDRLINFIKDKRKIIYYCSDNEFKVGNLVDNHMLLYYCINNPDDELSKLLFDKLILIIDGLCENSTLKYYLPNIPIIHFPQLINPKVPIIKDPTKYYDFFLINISKSYKGVIDILVDQGYKILTLVGSEKAVHPKVYAIVFRNNGYPYYPLIELVSKCKFYLGTNTYWSDDEDAPYKYYCSDAYTSKYLESYYANTIPVPSYLTPNMIDYWIKNTNIPELNNNFRSWMENNMTSNNFKSKLNDICNIINQNWV